MTDNVPNVALQNPDSCCVVEIAFPDPRRQLIVPDEGVAPHKLLVGLRQLNDFVSAGI